MPVTCIVVGCGSRADRDALSFFAVPKETHFKHAMHLNKLSAERRLKWIQAIKRDDLTDSKLRYERVCSKHFISEKPAALNDVNNPDWVPSQNMGYITGHLKRQGDLERSERVKVRRLHKEVIDKENISKLSQEDNTIVPDSVEREVILESGTSTQTDVTGDDFVQLHENLSFASKKVDDISKRLNKSILTYEALKNDNAKCHYYTGLNFPLVNIIFMQIEKYISTTSVTALEPFQQVLLVLIKLRLNLAFKDLGYRFGISQSTCTTYFNLIIDIMYKRFKSLIICPERKTINKNIPSCFKEVFHEKTTVIIDCFEVFIERPASYLTQQQTWSNYKHHNTIKFLIGITPQGTISYVSNAWGGRTSDKQIVELSGFLNNIIPQDIVLADRGFLISDSLAMLQAKLVIPAFTKGKNQLVPIEIEETRKIAQVRIHVERIIGSIKGKFSIFKGPIPISMLTYVSNNVNVLDKMIVVCCALINMCPPIVPL